MTKAERDALRVWLYHESGVGARPRDAILVRASRAARRLYDVADDLERALLFDGDGKLSLPGWQGEEGD